MGAEVAVVAESATAGPEVGVSLVDPSFDSPHMFLRDFVAHGIGERLDGRGRRDAVAVQMQERMQLDQR